jgi:lysophospholipase L1-like esterase
MNSRSETPALHRQLMQYDETIGYRFAPGLKLRIPHEGGGYLVRTNQEGFRCDHDVTARKRRTHRVLVFGDSYTAGDGVSNGKRYSDVLEQSLGDTEVLNFGLSGSGTDQQYLVFRQYAKQLEYDALVIGVLVENIKRNTAQYREWFGRAGESLCVPKPWFELSSDAELNLKGVPVPRPYKKAQTPSSRFSTTHLSSSARRMVNRLGPDFKDWLQRVTRLQPLPEYGRADHESWKLMQAILAKWVSEIDVPVVVAAIPVYQYVDETASYKHVRERFDELAELTGVPVYHVLTDLLPYPAETRRAFRFRIDCHLTPLGHQVVGEALAKIVAPLLSGQTLAGLRPEPALSGEPHGGDPRAPLTGMGFPIQPQG